MSCPKIQHRTPLKEWEPEGCVGEMLQEWRKCFVNCLKTKSEILNVHSYDNIISILVTPKHYSKTIKVNKSLLSTVQNNL